MTTTRKMGVARTLGVVLLCLVVTCVHRTGGQAALYAPPGRSAMWAYMGNAAYATSLTPNFDYTTNLNCGGKVVTPTTYMTSCGPCGDPVNPSTPGAVRPNEAPGGEYAIGEVVWYYHEAATINVTLDVRTHLAGGFYQFALCKTDASTVVTHDCFSHKLSWADTGQTTLPAPTYSGRATYTLQLPVGLTCDYCVLQWKWIDGGYTCRMLDVLVCGPTVTNCADIAIVPQGASFPQHFDWPRYDQYASIFSADGNRGTDPHHTTPSIGPTTDGIREPTTTQPTVSTASTTSIATTPSWIQTTPSNTNTAIAPPTTKGPIIIIVPTLAPPNLITTTREAERTTEGGGTAGSTTTVSTTTVESARFLDPLIPGAIALTGLVSGNTTLGIIFLLLALFASQIREFLQPLGRAPMFGVPLPVNNYPVMMSAYTPVPALQWYGRPYVGHRNIYASFSTPYTGAVYQRRRKYVNSRGGPKGNGNRNGYYVNQGYRRYMHQHSGFGIKSPRYKGNSQRNTNSRFVNQRFSNHGYNGRRHNGGVHGYSNNGHANPTYKQTIQGNGGYNQNVLGNYNQNGRISSSNDPLQGVVAEYDNDPAPSVIKTPRDPEVCHCRGKLEVFTVYCMNYKENRDGCEAEDDICFCR